ncbi:hypothetical protein BS47DRAFT_1335081 [Hydnum rufescens UP504]|uniref:Exonuclease domain-containing protein n=1 Tax=Hydnum rufescens UP504 TaxID=1448309 RepID=A0A9P6BAY9_9AGAM|nr:hypothetical protein BS47DRAFT_1335081 [Hydnum rufescens UP504]
MGSTPGVGPSSASVSSKRKRDELDNGTVDLSKAGTSSLIGSRNDEIEPGARQKKKKKKNKAPAPAVFAFDSGDLRSRTQPVSLQSLRSLILAIVENSPPDIAPKFISAPGRASIKRIAVLHIPGITPDAIGMPPPPSFTVARPPKKLHPSSLFAGAGLADKAPVTPPPPSASSAPAFPLLIASKRPETQLPAMSKLFSHGLPTRAFGEGTKLQDTMNTFLLGPLNKPKEKTKDSGKASLFGDQSTSIESLILSMAELEREAFLLPSTHPYVSLEQPTGGSSVSQSDLSYVANGWDSVPGLPIRTDEWVEAPPAPADSGAGGTSPNNVVLAIDCEMVDTSRGKELARIAVVDFWTEELIFDELVKPADPIVDYLTQYSGITPSMLGPISTTLRDIQQRLLLLMRDSQAILIGHHISNDLRALRLAHARCIDTSVTFHNLQRPDLKPSLKWLTQHWTGQTIQVTNAKKENGETIVGHSPIEDAKACVALIRKKVERGLAFGKSSEARTMLFQNLKAANMSSAYVGGAAMKYGHGPPLPSNATKMLRFVIDNVISCLQTHDFVFGRMQQLSRALGWTSTTTLDSGSVSPAATEAAFKNVNTSLKKLTASLPPSTALMIYTGCSDPRRMGIMNRKKASWDAKIRSGVKNEDIPSSEQWTLEDAEQLELEVEKVKAGLAFFCISLGASGMPAPKADAKSDTSP